MTDFKNHIGIGIVFALVFFLITQYSPLDFTKFEMIVAIGVMILYPILADIDHRMSMITKIFLLISAGLVNVGYFYYKSALLPGIILLDVVVISSLFLHHRGPTHTIQAALLSPLLLYPLLGFGHYWIYGLAAVCYWSHLVADKIPFKLSYGGQKGTQK